MTNRYIGRTQIATINPRTEQLKVIASFADDERNERLAQIITHRSYDYYESKNPLKTGRSIAQDNLLGLKRFVIDVDLHSKNLNSEQLNQHKNELIIFLIEQNSFLFSKIIDTGRGLQIHINFNQVAATLDWLYKLSVNFMIKRLEQIIETAQKDGLLTQSNFIEIDPVSSKNPSGYIRLENTVNTKTDTIAKTIIDYQRVYDLTDIFQTEINEQEIETKPLQEKTATPIYEQDLINRRVKFLLEEYTVAPGNRDIYFFLLYNNLVQVKEREQAKIDIKLLNRKLKVPLKQNKIESIFKYIDSKNYLLFKQETFNEWIGETMPTTREQRKSKQSEKKKRDEIINTLLKNKDLTYSDIAKTVGLSEKTIKRRAKQQGLTRNN